jgi:hypothetical protein
MFRARKIILGVFAAAALFVLLLELTYKPIGDGWPSVAVTVRSEKPIRLRRVRYINVGQKAAFDSCMQQAQFIEWKLCDATIQDSSHFEFGVPCSERPSPFRLWRNRFTWARFAVFRIETDAGDVYHIGAEVPDVSKTKSITIDVP